jgi:hypothetical protein
MSPEELDNVVENFLRTFFMRGQDVGQPIIPDLNEAHTPPRPLSSITFEDLTETLTRLEREYGPLLRHHYYPPFLKGLPTEIIEYDPPPPHRYYVPVKRSPK